MQKLFATVRNEVPVNAGLCGSLENNALSVTPSTRTAVLLHAVIPSHEVLTEFFQATHALADIVVVLLQS